MDQRVGVDGKSYAIGFRSALPISLEWTVSVSRVAAV